MQFQIIGKIRKVETIAVGSSIHKIQFLRKMYGSGRWLKRKGVANVQLKTGDIRLVELHWYEAHGIGKKHIKIKRPLD